jgi:hypothetical protein
MMDMATHSLFKRFVPLISTYRKGNSSDEIVMRQLKIAQQGTLEVFYAPFDHIAQNASMVIVGITPGRTQAINALSAASDALKAGKTHADVLRLAKLTGSFSGSMRANLVSMLDHVGVAAFLGMGSCVDLFNSVRERVHFTSALRYPVLVGGSNYNGSPDMLRTPLLKSFVDSCLTEEAEQLRSAIWLPLGPQPQRALEHLCQRGVLHKKHILDGLPHPSGANAERIAYFVGRKQRSALSSKTNPLVLDAALKRLRLQVAGLDAPSQSEGSVYELAGD